MIGKRTVAAIADAALTESAAASTVASEFLIKIHIAQNVHAHKTFIHYFVYIAGFVICFCRCRSCWNCYRNPQRNEWPTFACVSMKN